MIIYKIENKINGKIYVGQTVGDLSNRVAGHVKSNMHIGNALRKYGLESFTISVIDHADTKEVLNEKEKYWIKILTCQSPNGYNLAAGGEGGDLSKFIKYGPRSEKTKAKTSATMKGKTSPMKGRVHPAKGTKMDEEKKKHMRHPKSEEGRENMKKGAKKSYIEGRNHYSKINKKGHNKGQIAWNKGLTKEKDERVKNIYLTRIKNKEQKDKKGKEVK